jgi:leader peptidase (prepilin peptidase) / N-methyltransferase
MSRQSVAARRVTAMESPFLSEGKCTVSLFTELPLPLRIAIIFLLGMLVSRFINWAIYSWAYFPQSLGPWSPPHQSSNDKRSGKPVSNKSVSGKSVSGKSGSKKARQPLRMARSWLDHLPILGWWRLRDEATVHGRWYWIRPLLIELIYPLALAWYYRFYISGGSLPPGASRFLIPLAVQMHWQFFGHFFLFSFLTIATFIDFDEQSIPDKVTIPGTVVGIIGAALSPLWLPLTLDLGVAGAVGVTELDASWPQPWPLYWNHQWGLFLCLGILGVWGFALMDRRIILRRGYKRAWVYFWARMFRNRRLWVTICLVTLGLMAFTTLAWMNGFSRWQMLVSSLLGLAFAGGVTWAVRLSASYGFGAEALGFGDVTLMAMIGTFIGWQPSLVVFFLAPLLALGFVLIRWVITRDTATPYGPYLCASVLVLLVFWDSIWIGWAAPIFALGPQPILVGLLVCVALIGIMLWAWQLIKRAVWQ